MIWFFATVVLVLAVLHQGFRTLVFWIGGIAAIIVVIFSIGILKEEPTVSVAKVDPNMPICIHTAPPPADDEFAGFTPEPCREP